MIVARIAHGIRSHFRIRVSEWVMAWPAFGMWFALTQDPEMFQVSPSFEFLARWGYEHTWATFFLICGLCRLAALTINGTFQGFHFSPHIRAAASIVGALTWAQLSLGFLMAFIAGNGAFSGVIGWSTMVILETVNIHRSLSDIGETRSRR